MDYSSDSPSERPASELVEHERLLDDDIPEQGSNRETRRGVYLCLGCKVTFLLVLSVFSAVFGSSTQFGFNLAVVNNLEHVIRSSLSVRNGTALVVGSSFSEIEWATAVAIFAFGGMVGSIPAGIVADLIGRKWAMLANNAVAVAGVLLQSLAVHPFMLIIGRFVIGINAGANTVLAPLYITEISPLKYRGTMGVFVQLAITSTILVSQLLGIDKVLGRPDSDYYGWRILLAVPLLFVTVQLLTLPFCPESPKYLYIKKRNEDEAKKALMKLSGSHSYQADLEVLQDEASTVVSTDSIFVTLKKFLVNSGLRRAIFISIALHLSQQITGIGSILMYSTDVFDDSGIKNGDIATAVVGLSLLIGTVITIVLIDRVGRRTLMLYGLGGMFVFFGFISSVLCYQYVFYSSGSMKYSPTGILLVIFTLLLTFSFAIGPGAIPWLLVGELFQQAARPAAVTIATITNWSSNFTVGFVFPFILRHFKPYPFVIFIAITGLFWLIIYFYLPETKGKTVDEVTEYFRKVTEKPSCMNKLTIKRSRQLHSPPPIIN